jgi:hypothetical protein
MNIQQVCPYVLTQHFCLPLLTRSPTHSLDRYHPIATALVLPTLVNKVLILACVLKLKDILWRLSTRPLLVNNNQVFIDPRFRNGSLTSNNSHHTLLASPKDWYRHHNHPAHHIGRFAPPGCLCFVTPELSTTPKACATGCRLNLLSLISPDTVSCTLRSAGVGHRFYNYLQPLVGHIECKPRILPIPY